MSSVACLAEARRRKSVALRLAPSAQEWRELDQGWSVRPAPEEGVWVRWGLRVRLFEACRLGRLARAVHCPACKRPLVQGEKAFREASPRDEPVSWREVRICARCVEVKRADER